MTRSVEIYVNFNQINGLRAKLTSNLPPWRSRLVHQRCQIHGGSGTAIFSVTGKWSEPAGSPICLALGGHNAGRDEDVVDGDLRQANGAGPAWQTGQAREVARFCTTSMMRENGVALKSPITSLWPGVDFDQLRQHWPGGTGRANAESGWCGRQRR